MLDGPHARVGEALAKEAKAIGEEARKDGSKETPMSYEQALEMARCTEVNLENTVKMMPLMSHHPLLPIVKLQIRQTIEELEGELEDGE